MARRITNEQIEQINLLYYKYKTYSAVAKEVGCSPATVKKYVIDGFTPAAAENVRHVYLEELSFGTTRWRPQHFIEGILLLKSYEIEELKELWEELSI